MASEKKATTNIKISVRSFESTDIYWAIPVYQALFKALSYPSGARQSMDQVYVIPQVMNVEKPSMLNS